MRSSNSIPGRVTRGRLKSRGFALVISLSLMVLLTVLAVGLLSLSSISLRKSNSEEAKAQAYANARMAVLLALGQLQKYAGDDRRITADASIDDSAQQGNMVGVYSSWTHNFVSQPDRTIGTSVYSGQKTSSFKTWLTSGKDMEDLRSLERAKKQADLSWINLYSLARNGFDLSAEPLDMGDGSVAWAVTQENTKAKVSVGGPDDASDLPDNAILQAQLRPSLENADGLNHPEAGWNERAGKVISMNQIRLDGQLADGGSLPPTVGKSYTVHSQGLLTDAVLGGLKVDLNLAFEMGDSDFDKASWGGMRNPFRGTSKAGFASPTPYKGQVPLFRPLSGIENPLVTATVDFAPATVTERFLGAGVPTFDHLRSYYRVAHYVYGGNSPTVAERAPDHVAITLTSSSAKPSPSKAPPGVKSVMGIKPVLNRMIYLLSAALDAQNRPALVLTPIVSLWNPYNVALEIEGAVAYPWIDVPFDLDWTFSAGGAKGTGMSPIMGKQFLAQTHGRQINPYFLCQITADGTGSITRPIRFEPGEVRVFAPAAATPVPFTLMDTLTAKTVKMRPVDNINQFSTKGGLRIPMKATSSHGDKGFDYVMKSNETAKVRFRESSTTGAYHFFVTLEDATRIKQTIADDAQGGQTAGDVQMLKFKSKVNYVDSPPISYGEMVGGAAAPFGVVESYHRAAVDNVGSPAVTPIDLLYTVNPRNPSITHLLTPTSANLAAAPHYETSIRAVASANAAIRTANDGRNSFWGASQNAGEFLLPFFDLPTEPMLSLANFQNADLGSSSYGAAYQFGNSRASAWLTRSRAAVRSPRSETQGPIPIYDTSFLANEALWDSYFFSGAAPRLRPGSAPTSIANVWNSNGLASEERSLRRVLQDFMADPVKNPLGNPRMRLDTRGEQPEELANTLLDPEGCLKIASYLTVDGAFNINSTDVDAWVALLSGMRGQSFQVGGSNTSSGSETVFPRFRTPVGSKNDIWNGYRSLSDGQIETLAQNIVTEVKLRGPFLSLSEFVNRRIEGSELGKAGAIQAAIDKAALNTKLLNLSIVGFPPDARTNITPDTGVGLPGHLTQADVLQSLAPVITCRSDTFTIRGYGDAKDADGKIIARAWCEAVVQRTPDFVDSADSPDSAIADLEQVNQTFGRRFQVVSFRQVPWSEINPS